MRSIKFRGLRTDGKGWVYGLPYSSCYDGEIDQIVEWENHYDVKPETISQFTGLRDKNGVEIYEGDVIQLTREEEYGELIYITDNKYTYETAPIPNRIFETLTLMDFIYTVMYSEDHGGLWGRSPEHIEVIGNIHENK